MLREGADVALELARVTRRLSSADRLQLKPGAPSMLQLFTTVILKRRGGRTTLTSPPASPASERARPDAVLIAGLRRAHALKRKLGLGERIGADAASPTTQYEQRLLALAFLSPELQTAILAGRQPDGLSLQNLILNATPLAWADQAAHLATLARGG